MAHISMNSHCCNKECGVQLVKFLLNRFATFVEALLQKAVAMGLQVNYNSEVQKLIEADDGSFTMTTRDGRVRL